MKEMYGVVLLYTEGMAICEDDWENLWCAEMPEEFVTAGDGIEIDGLTPLEDLPMEQQVRIKMSWLHCRKNIWTCCVIMVEVRSDARLRKYRSPEEKKNL